MYRYHTFLVGHYGEALLKALSKPLTIVSGFDPGSGWYSGSLG